MSALHIDLAGETWDVTPDDDFSFGRDADLVVDSNRYLHRRLGCFRCRDGVWWLVNLGSAIGLEIADRESPSTLTLAPGTATPLPFSECWIRFSAGPISYELEVTLPDIPEFEFSNPTGDGSTTIGASKINLNYEQRLLLVALAEPRMRRSASSNRDLPTNRQVADRLGWTITKFNRKLDNLCTKFDRLGVSGIKGDLGGMAVSRRERLIEHVVTAGIVGPQHLPMLEESKQ